MTGICLATSAHIHHIEKKCDIKEVTHLEKNVSCKDRGIKGSTTKILHFLYSVLLRKTEYIAIVQERGEE